MIEKESKKRERKIKRIKTMREETKEPADNKNMKIRR